MNKLEISYPLKSDWASILHTRDAEDKAVLGMSEVQMISTMHKEYVSWGELRDLQNRPWVKQITPRSG